MTEQQHPMIPPNILLNNWESDWFAERENVDVLLIQAYQAGADAELEACIELIKDHGWFANPEHRVNEVRDARRPKPLSLQEQALMALEDGDTGRGALLTAAEVSIIRRTLEALPDD